MTTESLPPLPPLPLKDGVEYRHIPGFYGYIAGNDGTIFSARVPTTRGGLKVAHSWTLKYHWPNEDGYRTAHLVPTTGKAQRKFVHVVVLETFVGPCPRGMETLHDNGVPDDNRLSNLRWGTRAENMADARRHGTLARRERNGQAKLNDLKVKAVHALRAAGWTQRDVAAVLGVRQPTISAVENGHRWETIGEHSVDICSDKVDDT